MTSEVANYLLLLGSLWLVLAAIVLIALMHAALEASRYRVDLAEARAEEAWRRRRPSSPIRDAHQMAPRGDQMATITAPSCKPPLMTTANRLRKRRWGPSLQRRDGRRLRRFRPRRP